MLSTRFRRPISRNLQPVIESLRNAIIRSSVQSKIGRWLDNFNKFMFFFQLRSNAACSICSGQRLEYVNVANFRSAFLRVSRVDGRPLSDKQCGNLFSQNVCVTRGFCENRLGIGSSPPAGVWFSESVHID